MSGDLVSLCWLTAESGSSTDGLFFLLSFKGNLQTSFPSSLLGRDASRQHFLKLLVQQIRDSVVFEGPDGSKNLALDSQGKKS